MLLYADIHGDLIVQVNNISNRVVNYTYDAWGNPGEPTGSMANTLGKHNPLRYRGYVYDTETGLYYLQSRYYNPEIGRFINADSYASTGQGILGNNMFAYCSNNPAIAYDPSGNFASPILGYFETLLQQIGEAISGLVPVYAGLGALPAADGPAPLADLLSAAGITALSFVALGYGIQQTIQIYADQDTKFKEEEEILALSLSPKRPVIFPLDPNDFMPMGLKKVVRQGTKNGMLISWMDPYTNTEVFRWDENPNYANGAHYHIFGHGHYIPGVSQVPEPLATIYFSLLW